MAWSATSSMTVSGSWSHVMAEGGRGIDIRPKSTPTEAQRHPFSFLPASITLAVMRGRPLA